jgi:hypothetical protein
MTADLALRVFVLDAWDDIVMQLPSLTPIADVKRRALESAHVTGDPAAFLVKFRGAELSDESRSLADERVPSDGALIVMRRRRVPVR